MNSNVLFLAHGPQERVGVHCMLAQNSTKWPGIRQVPTEEWEQKKVYHETTYTMAQKNEPNFLNTIVVGLVKHFSFHINHFIFCW